jgi:hypothetical protein
MLETTSTGYLVPVYAVYLAISLALTLWLARTLFRNGAAFLKDVFDDRPDLAEAVNRLLVVGFYLFNLGYACLILRADPVFDGVAAIETMAAKLGLLLLSLAGMHFFNMYLFHRIRRRSQLAKLPPPVLPTHLIDPGSPHAAWGGPTHPPSVAPLTTSPQGA